MRALSVAIVPVLLALSWTALAKEWPTKVASDHDRGKELYDRHCLACHGPKGAGDGLLAASLRAPIPNFEAGFGDKATDELVKAVLHGKGLMPAYETSFAKDDAEKVVKFMAGVGKEVDKPKDDKKPADDDGADGDVGGG